MDARTLHLLEFGKVLDKLKGFAASEPGMEACLAIRPCGAISEVREQLELYRQVSDWRGQSGQRLGNFPDLSGLFGYLEQQTAVLDLDALYALRLCLQALRGLRDSILENERNAEERWPQLAAFLSVSPWPQKVWSALRRCLSDEGALQDHSSPELASVRAEIRRLHRQCTHKAKDFIQDHALSAYLQEDFMTISSDRYVLPLKTNFKGRVSGVIHDYSQTGETCYFEPLFLVELNNELQELKQEERDAERKVLAELTGLVRQEFESVRKSYDQLLALDVLQAKIRFSEVISGQALELEENGQARLHQARHPLLALEAKGSAGAVPVDIVLDPGQRGLVISGGNAGGKTVCLKTLGLLALMAMSAIPVPVAEGSELPFWNNIFVFLGDEQSIEGHMSTFSAQIVNLSRVWDRVDASSFVILDEFGAGTDPSQGAALAQAAIDSVLEKQAYVAAATHFPALKAYALAKENVRAASVLFDPSTRKPLYRLAFDQVGLSQALDVARTHGMPEEILKRAEEYLLLDSSDTSNLIDRLNQVAVEREQETRRLAAERAKFQEKRAKLEERFEREKRVLLEELGDRSREIMRQMQQDKISRKQAHKELKEMREQLDQQERKQQLETVRLEELDTGAAVMYVPWGKKGLLEEKDSKRGQVKLNINGVSMWAKSADLAPAEAPVKSGQTLLNLEKNKKSSLILDLRGFTADVALIELGKFLDKAILGNISEVEIVHGRGTGVLRREVHKFLGEFPAVSAFALANEDRGGDGMTLVELK